MNIAQSWTVIGVLAAFGVTIAGLMAQLAAARVDQILTRITGLEERIDTRMDRLEGRMDRLETRTGTLDRGVRTIATRVFRGDRWRPGYIQPCVTSDSAI